MEFLLFLLVAGGLLWWFSKSSTAQSHQNTPNPTPPKADRISPEQRHLQQTLAFAQQQQRKLKGAEQEKQAWQREYGSLKIQELAALSGTEFEQYLAGIFRNQGYAVQLTAQTGDYGADLIVSKDEQRIAIQAKCYVGSVGVQAVQEVLAGKAYYQCNAAWVITTGTFTANAHVLARKSDVQMFSRDNLGLLIAPEPT